ncbi:hypothetical protein GJAV_G00170580, partial [Gymnothorax javanicus]
FQTTATHHQDIWGLFHRHCVSQVPEKNKVILNGDCPCRPQDWPGLSAVSSEDAPLRGCWTVSAENMVSSSWLTGRELWRIPGSQSRTSWTLLWFAISFADDQDPPPGHQEQAPNPSTVIRIGTKIPTSYSILLWDNSALAKCAQ